MMMRQKVRIFLHVTSRYLPKDVMANISEGIAPPKKFDPTERLRRSVSSAISFVKVPERKFEEMSRNTKEFIFAISCGIFPVKKFVPISKTDRSVSPPIASVIDPLSWLSESSSLFSLLRLSKSEGRRPLNPFLSRETFSTTFCSESHNIPNHAFSTPLLFVVPQGLFSDVQSSLEFQFIPLVEKYKVLSA